MPATARAPDAEVHYIREVILRHLGKRVGKTFAQIRSAVENDYGSMSSGHKENADRRLYRHLEFLVDAGCIRRERDTMAQWDREDNDGAMASQFFYFFVHDRIPPPCKVFCRVCGLVGARSTSHGNGHRDFMSKLEGDAFYVSIEDKVRRPAARSRAGGVPGREVEDGAGRGLGAEIGELGDASGRP